MVVPVFCGGIAPSTKQARLKALEEQRRLKVLKAEQLAKEYETNPALRNQVQLEAQRKFEAQRDFAFQQMQDLEQQRIHGLPSLSHEIAAHKQFWAWRKQAKSELEHLRETERLSRERFAQDTNILTHPRGKKPPQPTNTGESRVSPSLSCPNEFADILPIITPAAFAMKQQSTPDQHPWFRSGTTESTSSIDPPPGKRFSVSKMPQVQCKSDHYHWIQQSLRLGIVKDYEL